MFISWRHHVMNLIPWRQTHLFPTISLSVAYGAILFLSMSIWIFCLFVSITTLCQRKSICNNHYIKKSTLRESQITNICKSRHRSLINQIGHQSPLAEAGIHTIEHHGISFGRWKCSLSIIKYISPGWQGYDSHGVAVNTKNRTPSQYKDGLSRYGDSHYKEDKTVVMPSQFNHLFRLLTSAWRVNDSIVPLWHGQFSPFFIILRASSISNMHWCVHTKWHPKNTKRV